MNVNPKRLTKRTFHYRASILPRDIWQSSYDCNLKSQNLSAKARLFCTSAFWSAKGNLPSLRWLDARPRPGVDSRKDLASPDDTEVPWRAMYSKSLDFKEVVGASGFEPPTSWSRTRRASQAALRPEILKTTANSLSRIISDRNQWYRTMLQHEESEPSLRLFSAFTWRFRLHWKRIGNSFKLLRCGLGRFHKSGEPSEELCRFPS